ncbi:MAG TPA: hypothetical protein VLK60_03815 [Variovorax sp.]|nr:hypothetical protein [Variovorax sp.]
MHPRHLISGATGATLAALALAASAALAGCDRKPSAPPAPSAGGTSMGPTAASGGAPTAGYPAGIKAAPSGDTVAKSGTHDGPGEGATAIGGVTPSANVTPPPIGNSTAPTGGDGRPATPDAPKP